MPSFHISKFPEHLFCHVLNANDDLCAKIDWFDSQWADFKIETKVKLLLIDWNFFDVIDAFNELFSTKFIDHQEGFLLKNKHLLKLVKHRHKFFN